MQGTTFKRCSREPSLTEKSLVSGKPSDETGPTAILSGDNDGVTQGPVNDAAVPFPDPGPPPDGGTAAWIQALCGFLLIFMSWGLLTSFGVFQSHYQETLHLPPSDITWIGSVEIFLIFFIGTFSGRALDAGYFRPIFITGITLSVFGTFMVSLCTTYWELLLAQGVAIGIGDGLMFTPAIGLISTYFNRRRSMVLAFCASGAAIGGMVFPAMMRGLLPRVGFGWSVRSAAFVQMGIAALLIACLRPRLPPRPSGPLVEWGAFKEAPYTLFIMGMFFNWWAMYFAFYYVRSPLFAPLFHANANRGRADLFIRS